MSHLSGFWCGALSWAFAVFFGFSWCGSGLADDRRDPTVGAEGRIDEIILPGTELKGMDLVGGSPIAVRVLKSFVHGDSFRYQLQFFGFEPGQYNLADYLERLDGSSTGDLPPIPVEIRSLLPAGQIEPNSLTEGWLPRFGGYRTLAYLAAVVWVIGLLFLIFYRRAAIVDDVVEQRPATLAEFLTPHLSDAAADRLKPSQYAELERMLFAFWRERLQLNDVLSEQALTIIHENPESGPLMKQLEQWMHNPVRDPDVNLSDLLKPYEKIPIERSGVKV